MYSLEDEVQGLGWDPEVEDEFKDRSCMGGSKYPAKAELEVRLDPEESAGLS